MITGIVTVNEEKGVEFIWKYNFLSLSLNSFIPRVKDGVFYKVVLIFGVLIKSCGVTIPLVKFHFTEMKFSTLVEYL